MVFTPVLTRRRRRRRGRRGAGAVADGAGRGCSAPGFREPIIQRRCRFVGNPRRIIPGAGHNSTEASLPEPRRELEGGWGTRRYAQPPLCLVFHTELRNHSRRSRPFELASVTGITVPSGRYPAFAWEQLPNECVRGPPGRCRRRALTRGGATPARGSRPRRSRRAPPRGARRNHASTTPQHCHNGDKTR